MCPACLTTLVLMAAGAGSAGGVAVAVKKLHTKSAAKELVRKDAPETHTQKEEPR